MQYFITFLWGLINFTSPCILLMLPVYITLFAAGENNQMRTVKNAFGFVLGFTVVLVCLGAFAGTLHTLLHQYEQLISIISGIIIMIFGFHFLGLFKIKFLHFETKSQTAHLGFVSSFAFGIAFLISHTHCIGPMLLSSLAFATFSSHQSAEGIFLLLSFSLGLGIPFILCALLIDKLKGAFEYLKKHSKTINQIAGSLLILIGVLISLGLFEKFLSLFE